MTRVAVGIIRKNGNILLCQRKKGSRYELKWEFPGGKVEPGESFLECLKRELEEELSIRVHSVDRMEFGTWHYNDGGVYEVAFCFISDFEGEPRNNVFAQIQWVKPPDLPAFDILEGNKDIVRELAREE